jgi:monovalent cation/hydrogen antiporter
MTGHLELWLLGLLAAVAGLVMLANRLGVPYPVFLVLGGLALGLVPIVPEIGLPPDLVLLIFLPPLLYSAAFFSSPRDLKANLRPIASLSIGLVLLTTLTVASVAHLLVGLPWAAAFVLGAIVSPTDPVAATAIAGRLGAPRRIVTILEGESLINDATASRPRAAKRSTATRNAPWRTSASGRSCWAQSARSSSGSGAKDASATR